MAVQKRLRSFFLIYIILILPSLGIGGETQPDPEKLLKAGEALAEKAHYLEAIDLLEKTRDILEASAADNTRIYSDVMFALAQTKIKARLQQDFPANYVKTALHDVKVANKLREKLSGVLPQKLAEGYFLEGYIHKRFFMRMDTAEACLKRAVSIDPTLGVAKRELSELQNRGEQK